MISATTLCKELLNVNGLVVDDADFFTNKYGELCILIKVHLRKGLQWKCPVCGKPMAMNLRADNTFVQDEGWYEAHHRYEDFVRRHKGMKVVYLELGVGYNTPVIIKYPFWKWTAENENATYVCINLGEADAPTEIKKRSICIDGDINTVLEDLQK